MLIGLISETSAKCYINIHLQGSCWMKNSRTREIILHNERMCHREYIRRDFYNITYMRVIYYCAFITLYAKYESAVSELEAEKLSNESIKLNYRDYRGNRTAHNT